MDGRHRRPRSPATESGVQADSSVALLVRAPRTLVELVFRASVPVDTGRRLTAQRRPRSDHDLNARDHSGPVAASRRASLARADAVWLPPVRDACRRGRTSQNARGPGHRPGRRRPAPGRRAGGTALDAARLHPAIFFGNEPVRMGGRTGERRWCARSGVASNLAALTAQLGYRLGAVRAWRGSLRLLPRREAGRKRWVQPDPLGSGARTASSGYRASDASQPW